MPWLQGMRPHRRARACTRGKNIIPRTLSYAHCQNCQWSPTQVPVLVHRALQVLSEVVRWGRFCFFGSLHASSLRVTAVFQ